MNGWRRISVAALPILLCSCAQNSGPVDSRGICGPAPPTTVILNAAAAVSPSDIWTVGLYQEQGSSGVPLAEHWDGQHWTVVQVPVGPWTTRASLNAVSAAGPRDVWAVGSGQNVGEDQTLIEHWDGARWTIVRSPNLSARSNYLAALDVIATDDAWAVGYYYSPTRVLVLTEHWNGSSWTVIPAANPAIGMNSIAGISGTSSNDVWAVGLRRESDSVPQGTLVEHWDGRRWALVSSPSPGQSSSLTAVTAVSPDDVWAIGSYAQGDTFLPLFEHWDGTSWSVQAGEKALNVTMQSVASVGPADIWAAGASSQGQGDNWLIQHWDGSRWVTTTAAPGATGSVNAILPVNPADVWAIGTYLKTACGPDWALIQHWDGQAWRYIASPNDGHTT
jgi:hypothetical protein